MTLSAYYPIIWKPKRDYLTKLICLDAVFVEWALVRIWDVGLQFFCCVISVEFLAGPWSCSNPHKMGTNPLFLWSANSVTFRSFPIFTFNSLKLSPCWHTNQNLSFLSVECVVISGFHWWQELLQVPLDSGYYYTFHIPVEKNRLLLTC
jgi:hypothetical protein